MKVITVTRTTSAAPEDIWALLADVAGRTRWDGALESIEGSFELGARGSVKLKGQPVRVWEIVECIRPQRYTDRFFLPMGGRMDWVHSIEPTDDGCAVTFDISAHGSTAFILRPIMRAILSRELPPTVDKLVTLAEAQIAERANQR
ncbi:SRPBCC family protein [Nocardia sp. NBC_01327]|uniref:SRPBCC family protein n=1 Tax=Nocardia sp. NBC_01327 TaxID=2903593 RepID=UPI002E14C818|nr:SRPBCC family protein [Nocardia sp. NBC_01327]